MTCWAGRRSIPFAVICLITLAVLTFTSRTFAAYTEEADGIWTVPTYHSISVYWNASNNGVAALQYRTPGGTWQNALDLVYDNYTGSQMAQQYRGSIVNLTPGTTYEIRARRANDSGWRAILPTTTTWQDTSDPVFPIRETIVLDASLSHYETTTGGDGSGYVVYDGGPNATIIDGGYAATDCLVVRHSRVIIRNITFVRCGYNAVCVTGLGSPNCRAKSAGASIRDVIIERNDISGFGGPEVRTTFLNACPGLAGQIGFNEDGGVNIKDPNAVRITVQRNVIHDPTYRSLLWSECRGFRSGHTSGPRGIRVYKPGSGNWQGNHVFRYNEIVGSAEMPFEDCIGGGENASLAGVPGADTDIYSNVIRYCADDAIEADGGGMNVRVWGNYIDASGVAVSFSPMALGPGYFFRNVIDRGRMGNIEGQVSANMIKTMGASSTSAFRGPLYLFHNSSLRPYTNGGFLRAFAIGDIEVWRIQSRNNVWMIRDYFTFDQHINPDRDFRSSSFDYDLASARRFGDSGAAGTRIVYGRAVWEPGNGPSATPEDPPSGWYQLASDGTPSRGVDAGVAIKNFNRGTADTDGAPDMGAHEHGAPRMQFGVNANWTYQP
jgi:hypothetical protein